MIHRRRETQKQRRATIIILTFCFNHNNLLKSNLEKRIQNQNLTKTTELEEKQTDWLLNPQPAVGPTEPAGWKRVSIQLEIENVYERND